VLDKKGNPIRSTTKEHMGFCLRMNREQEEIQKEYYVRVTKEGYYTLESYPVVYINTATFKRLFETGVNETLQEEGEAPIIGSSFWTEVEDRVDISWDEIVEELYNGWPDRTKATGKFLLAAMYPGDVGMLYNPIRLGQQQGLWDESDTAFAELDTTLMTDAEFWNWVGKGGAIVATEVFINYALAWTGAGAVRLANYAKRAYQARKAARMVELAGVGRIALGFADDAADASLFGVNLRGMRSEIIEDLQKLGDDGKKFLDDLGEELRPYGSDPSPERVAQAYRKVLQKHIDAKEVRIEGLWGMEIARAYQKADEILAQMNRYEDSLNALKTRDFTFQTKLGKEYQGIFEEPAPKTFWHWEKDPVAQGYQVRHIQSTEEELNRRTQWYGKLREASKSSKEIKEFLGEDEGMRFVAAHELGHLIQRLSQGKSVPPWGGEIYLGLPGDFQGGHKKVFSCR